MTPAVTFEAVASDSELAAKLLNQYETELVSMYPKFTLSSGPSALPSDFTIPHGQFVIGYVNGEPCCSGGVKVVCSGAPITCEVKRMYVLPEFRGRGLSKALLTHLETIASSEFGACKIRLDTGPKQANSAALYTKSGYEKVPPFNDNEFASLWLEKTLARSYSQAVSSLYSLGISKTAAAINAAAIGSGADRLSIHVRGCVLVLVLLSHLVQALGPELLQGILIVHELVVLGHVRV